MLVEDSGSSGRWVHSILNASYFSSPWEYPSDVPLKSNILSQKARESAKPGERTSEFHAWEKMVTVIGRTNPFMEYGRWVRIRRGRSSSHGGIPLSSIECNFQTHFLWVYPWMNGDFCPLFISRLWLPTTVTDRRWVLRMCGLFWVLPCRGRSVAFSVTIRILKGVRVWRAPENASRLR